MVFVSEPALILDLASIEERCEVSPPYARIRAIAASVVLERHHGERELDPIALHHEERWRRGELRRVRIEERDRRTYAEPKQATEEAAEAVAFLVARDVLGLSVFRRLLMYTGADYGVRVLGAPETDAFERLEVSGIAEGSESTAKRLRDKLAQLARFTDEPAGYAVVANFREAPVEVMVARHAP